MAKKYRLMELKNEQNEVVGYLQAQQEGKGNKIKVICEIVWLKGTGPKRLPDPSKHQAEFDTVITNLSNFKKSVMEGELPPILTTFRDVRLQGLIAPSPAQISMSTHPNQAARQAWVEEVFEQPVIEMTEKDKPKILDKSRYQAALTGNRPPEGELAEQIYANVDAILEQNELDDKTWKESNFKFRKILGAGSFGLAIEVNDKRGRIYAIKIPLDNPGKIKDYLERHSKRAQKKAFNAFLGDPKAFYDSLQSLKDTVSKKRKRVGVPTLLKPGSSKKWNEIAVSMQKEYRYGVTGVFANTEKVYGPMGVMKKYDGELEDKLKELRDKPPKRSHQLEQKSLLNLLSKKMAEFLDYRTQHGDLHAGNIFLVQDKDGKVKDVVFGDPGLADSLQFDKGIGIFKTGTIQRHLYHPDFMDSTMRLDDGSLAIKKTHYDDLWAYGLLIGQTLDPSKLVDKNADDNMERFLVCRTGDNLREVHNTNRALVFKAIDESVLLDDQSREKMKAAMEIIMPNFIPRDYKQLKDKYKSQFKLLGISLPDHPTNERLGIASAMQQVLGKVQDIFQAPQMKDAEKSTPQRACPPPPVTHKAASTVVKGSHRAASIRLERAKDKSNGNNRLRPNSTA